MSRRRRNYVLKKRYCQKCGKEIQRKELNESVLDACQIVIMENTLNKHQLHRTEKEQPKFFYMASTKRKAAYTVCHECAEHLAAYMAQMMPLPSIIEEESENESQV